MRIALILTIILSSASVFGQVAELSFEGRKVAKLGDIEEGEQVEHTFHFTNSGDVPLVISNYKVSCECTKAFYSDLPILPGESSTIRVTFDTTGKIGWQYRTVTLYANTKKGTTEVELRLKVITK